MFEWTHYHEGWRLRAECVLDDHTLRVYDEQGDSSDRPVVCFIHGLGESWDIWHGMRRWLSGRFRLFCLDLPWSGNNGQQWGQSRTAQEWLREAFQLMPAAPAALIAHSFGANAALEYLQSHHIPALRAVVLVSPFYLTHTEDLDWGVFQSALQNFHKTMEQGVEVRQQLRGNRNIALLSAMVNKVVQRIGPLGFIEFFSLFARTPALRLDRVAAPVLIVAGVDDITSPEKTNACLAMKLMDSRVEVVQDSGHFCMIEQPEHFGHVVDRYFTEVLSPAGVER